LFSYQFLLYFYRAALVLATVYTRFFAVAFNPIGQVSHLIYLLARSDSECNQLLCTTRARSTPMLPSTGQQATRAIRIELLEYDASRRDAAP
jgi:hypothetical protein